MSLQSAVLMGIGIYFLMMLWIAYSTKKHETEDDFVIGSRKVGIIPTVASIASGLRDGAGIVVWVGLGFLLGYAGILWLILGLTIGTILLGLYGPRMRDLAAKNNCITIGQMVRHFIGSRTAKYISFIIILFSTLVIAMQLFVAGNLISKIADIAPVFGILFSALVVAMYLMSGGYKAVIKTDTLQFFIILSLIFIPLFIQPKLVDIKDLSTVFAMGTENNIAILIIGVMYMLAGADIWQRIFSAKDGRTIVKSISMFPIFLFIMTLSLMWLGMGARNFVTTTNSDDVLFLLFKSPEIPVAVLAYIAIVIISITMSTLDTYTYLLSSTYLEDFTKYDVKKHKKEYIKFSRYIMAGALTFGSIAALFIGDVLQFVFSVTSIVYIFAPIFLLTAMGKFKKSERLDKAVTINMAVNTVIYFYMFTGGYFKEFINTAVPAGTSLIGILICLAFFNKEAKVEKVKVN